MAVYRGRLDGRGTLDQMPLAPYRTCRPGCSHLVRADKPCPVHGGPAKAYRWDTNRRPEVVRIRGRAGQARRRRVLVAAGFQCAICGRLTTDLIADHVTPLAEDGDGRDSLGKPMQALCRDCDKAKRHDEAMRGRR